MKDIKSYREKELSLFVISNIFIFLVAHQFIQIDYNDFLGGMELLSQVFASAVLLIIAFGLILTIECLFTDKLKLKLLYLFGFFGQLNPPGFTIFSDIREKDNDERFTYNTLVTKHPMIYDKLPVSNKERLRYENENWYALYSKVREVPMILASQRDYLLCRDIYISSLTILMLYIIATLKFVDFNLPYLIFLIVMIIITNIGANRKSKRFAYNVIACELNKS